jgi:hypothetical protein
MKRKAEMLWYTFRGLSFPNRIGSKTFCSTPKRKTVQGQFVARPNVARPNVTRLNVSRPNVAFLNVARPNVARPNVAPRGLK